MENKIKISQLPLESTFKEDALIPIVQDNSTKVIKSKDLLKEVDSKITRINEQLDRNVNKLNNDVKEILEKGTTVETIKTATEKEIQKQIDNGKLTNMTIADGSLTTSKYQNGSITKEKLSDDIELEPPNGSIGLEKFNRMARNTLVSTDQLEAIAKPGVKFSNGRFTDYRDNVDYQFTTLVFPINKNEIDLGSHIKFYITTPDTGADLRCILVDKDRNIVNYSDYKRFSGKVEAVFNLGFITATLTDNMWIGLESKNKNEYFRDSIGDTTQYIANRLAPLYKFNDQANFNNADEMFITYFEIINHSYGDNIIEIKEQMVKLKESLKTLEKYKAIKTTGKYTSDRDTRFSGWAYPFFTDKLKTLTFDRVGFTISCDETKEFKSDFVILDEKRNVVFCKRDIKVILKNKEILFPFTNEELESINNVPSQIFIGYCSTVGSAPTIAEVTDIDYPYDTIGSAYIGGYGNHITYQWLTVDNYWGETKISFYKTVYSDKDESEVEDFKLQLPKTIDMVVGDTIELFHTGMIDVKYSDDFYIYTENNNFINADNRILYTPTQPGTGILDITVTNKLGEDVLKDKREYIVRRKPTTVSTPKNILCIGDSLTEAGVWVEELHRRLTGTGGTPQGLQLNNIKFIGSNNRNGVCHEGNGGWKWDTYTGSNSPFYIGNKINIKQYCLDKGVETLDLCYILLGWNSTASPQSTVMEQAKVLIDYIHRDFPNCKIILMGIQPKYMYARGVGLAFPKINPYVFKLNRTYEEFTQKESYKEFMDFIDIAYQVDIKNNAQMESRPVNIRSTKNEEYISDPTHLATSGYLQIADAAYRNIVKYL